MARGDALGERLRQGLDRVLLPQFPEWRRLRQGAVAEPPNGVALGAMHLSERLSALNSPFLSGNRLPAQGENAGEQNGAPHGHQAFSFSGREAPVTATTWNVWSF